MLRVLVGRRLIEFPDWLEVVYDKGGWMSFVHAMRWKYPALRLRDVKKVLDAYRKLTGRK